MKLIDRMDLRYGENPHQTAYWEPNPRVALEQHGGKDLSFTNVLDVESALRVALEFEEPAAVVVKHMGPCGVATAEDVLQAFRMARAADEKSAYGGIVCVNRPIDSRLAHSITSYFLEVVVAPAVTNDAMSTLQDKKDLRILTADFDALKANLPGMESREGLLGKLCQERDYVSEAASEWPTADVSGEVEYPRVVTKRRPTAEEWRSLRFAWKICAHVKSNAVIFTKKDQTTGIGGGQPNRDNSAKIGRGFLDLKYISGHFLGNNPLRPGTVAASDAFFPFRDGLDQVVEAGATAVVQPGGSKRDEEVIDAADQHNIAMVFTGRRHFRH